MRNLLPLLSLPLAALASCSALERHTDASPWNDAITSFRSHPEQWVPTTVAAAATPLLLPFDHENTSRSEEGRFLGVSTDHGDEVALLLGLAPIAWGALDAPVGGDTSFLEVSSEAIVATLAETYAVKTLVDRGRPDGSAEDSFPSAQTSIAFAGATLLARRWQDENDGSLLGYALYVPATFVGLSSLKDERHWPSDVAFGAALGMLTANLVYDLHYGDEQSEGLFGHEGQGWYFTATPVVTPDGAAIALTLAF